MQTIIILLEAKKLIVVQLNSYTVWKIQIQELVLPNNAKGFVAVDEYVVGNLVTTVGFKRASGSMLTHHPNLIGT